MPQNTPANNYRNFFFIILVVTYLVYVSYNLSLRSNSDDQAFLTAFNNGGAIDFLKSRYMTWSGRVALEFVIVNTIGYTAFWKVAVPLSIILCCFSVCRIASKKPSISLFVFSILLYSLIPYGINRDAVWWVTGFYNYLLPISIALYVFSVVFRSNSSIERGMSIILTFYFPYMEQAGLCFTVATIALMALKKERRYALNYIILTFAAFNTAICILAPGNFIRNTHETWSLFPQYQYYGIFTKIALGFDKLHQLVTLKSNIPVILCFVVITLLGSRFKSGALSVKLSTIILSIYTSLLIASSLAQHSLGNGFISGEIILSTQWDSMIFMLSYLLTLLAIVSSFTILLSLINYGECITISFISMLVGYMSVMMMGFSPTVYASGMRVDMILELMFIISGCCLSALFISLIKNDTAIYD